MIKTLAIFWLFAQTATPQEVAELRDDTIFNLFNYYQCLGHVQEAERRIFEGNVVTFADPGVAGVYDEIKGIDPSVEGAAARMFDRFLYVTNHAQACSSGRWLLSMLKSTW